MVGADPNVGESALRLWVAVGSAALLVCICALAFDWTRSRIVVRISVIALGAVLGATLAWAFLSGASDRDRSAERRDLEMRAAQLNTQALAPGSPLACLSGLTGDEVEAACEKALFAGPATVAMATSYASARLALLGDMTAYIKRGGADIDSAFIPLQRSLEADRFGFVAQVLAVRDGCSSNSCPALALLHDSTRVRANLSGQTLGRYVDHYLTAWAQPSDVPPVAEAAPPPSHASAAGQPAGPGQHKIVDIDFPSAASIPAVSIMNPEPAGPPAAAAVASATAGAHDTAGSPAPASKPRKQPAAQPAQAAAAPAPLSDPPADPVWTPRTAAPAAVPPTSSATIAGPVQLTPPQANAGSAKTQ